MRVEYFSSLLRGKHHGKGWSQQKVCKQRPIQPIHALLRTYSIDMQKMKSICLVVIARNEARSIQRCLHSFAPHVDRMLVLDTGSSDGTVALAKSAGAQVEVFQWVDDFSAARNAALDLAAADWNLVADADEWLEGGAQCLPDLREGAATQIGKVLIYNQYDSRGQSGVVSARVPRLLPGHVRYQGSIHEQPDSRLPMVDIPLCFGHDGYCEAQRLRKEGRNEQMLRAALIHSPENPYLLYQLGCELSAWQSYAQAVLMYSQSLRLAPATADYRSELVRRLLSALQTEKEWMAAVNLLEQEMPRYANSRFFMLTAGNLFWNWAQAQPSQAAELLPMAEEAWMQVLHLAKIPAAEQGQQLEQAAEHAALSLHALCQVLGQNERAEQFQTLAHTIRASVA